ADYCLDGAAALVFAGSGIWARASISKGGRRKLFAVHGAWDYRNDGALLVDFLGNCSFVGPAVRILERDLGSHGAEVAGHGWSGGGCGDDGVHTGIAGYLRHVVGRISPGEFVESAVGVFVPGIDSGRVFGVGDGNRVEHAGYAGVSV